MSTSPVLLDRAPRSGAPLVDRLTVVTSGRRTLGRSPRWPAAMRFGSDIAALVIGVSISLGLRGRVLNPLAGPALDITTGRSLGAILPLWALLHVACLAAAGFYRPRFTRSVLDDLPRLTRGIAYGALADLVIVYSLRISTPRGLLLVASGAAWALIVVCRLVTNGISNAVLAAAPSGSRTVVVGSGTLAARVAATVEKHPEHGLRLVASVPATPDGIHHLVRLVEGQGVTQILVAASGIGFEVSNALRQCAAQGARISTIAPMPELMAPFGEHDRIGTLPVVHVAMAGRWKTARAVRGVVDWALGLVLAVVVSPFIAVLALAVKLETPGPAFFVQDRVGRGGRLFRCYKLRTMVEGADSMMAELAGQNEAAGFLFKIQDDPRVTRVGRWLRRMSLDELPQLFNVVRGDLSLIGPRPATPNEVERYPDWFRRRYAVKPGITGLWQVSGRSDLSFEESVRMDLTYVEGWSPWLDIQILFRTIGVLFTRRGAY